MLNLINTITELTTPSQAVVEQATITSGPELMNFTEILIRFAFNTLVLFCIVHFLYAKTSKRKDFYFSFLSVSSIIFLLCLLLNSVKLELGFAFGLFAIFGIIRYRTDAIPIKEMTYLFIVIGVSVMNALVNNALSLLQIGIINLLIFFALWILEKRLKLKQESSIHMIYEKIDNINLKNEAALLEDIKQRTGINISRIEIQKIDFLRDIAELVLFYNEKDKNL